MSERILSCHHHDYLEVACVLAYEVSVTTEQETIIGVAKDLSTSKKQEWLHLHMGSSIVKINLMDIIKIKTLTPNAQFTQVNFR